MSIFIKDSIVDMFYFYRRICLRVPPCSLISPDWHTRRNVSEIYIQISELKSGQSSCFARFAFLSAVPICKSLFCCLLIMLLSFLKYALLDIYFYASAVSTFHLANSNVISFIISFAYHSHQSYLISYHHHQYLELMLEFSRYC